MAELLKLMIKPKSTILPVGQSNGFPISAIKIRLRSNWTKVPAADVRMFFTREGNSIYAPIKNICMINPSEPICAMVVTSVKSCRPCGPSKIPAMMYALK